MIDLTAVPVPVTVAAGVAAFAAAWVLTLRYVCEASLPVCPKCGKPWPDADAARERLILETLRDSDPQDDRWKPSHPN